MSTGINSVGSPTQNLSAGITGTLPITNGGTGGTTAATARTALGLGTMATQDASAIAVTGGTVVGITDLAVADGGTGASDAATARTNLGLGTMSTQAASAVAVTGGTINGTPIGGSTPAAVAATTVSATGQITSTLATGTAPLVIASTTNVPNLNASSLSGTTATGSGVLATGGFTLTVPATGTAALLGTSQTYTGRPQFGSGYATIVATLTADTTLSSARCVILVDATSGNVTLTLPAANVIGANYTQWIRIVRIDASANTVSVQRAGSDTLNGGTTAITLANTIGTGKDFVSNSSNAWYAM